MHLNLLLGTGHGLARTPSGGCRSCSSNREMQYIFTVSVDALLLTPHLEKVSRGE